VGLEIELELELLPELEVELELSVVEAAFGVVECVFVVLTTSGPGAKVTEPSVFKLPDSVCRVLNREVASPVVVGAVPPSFRLLQPRG
jgi:hypothetical protein